MTAPKKGRRLTDQEARDAQDVPEAVLKLREFAGAGEGKAQVTRKDLGKDEEYLGTVHLSDLKEEPYEVLRARWGGGRYHLRCYDVNGDYIKGGSLFFSIAGPPLDPAAASETEKRLDEFEARFRGRIEAANNGAGTPEIWLMLGQTLSELRGELRRPQPQAVEGANFVELAMGLLETVGAAAAPLVIKLIEKRDDRPDPMEQMESMLRMAAMLKELGGQQTPTDGWGAIATRLADPLARIMSQHVDNQAGGTAPFNTLPPGAPTMQNPPTPPAAAAAGPQPARPVWYQLIARGIPQLLAWAAEGKGPELRAQLMLEDLPEQYLEGIFEQLSRGDAFLTEFIDQVPQAAPHRDWFRRFFGEIYTTMREWAQEGGAELEGEPPPVWEVGEGAPAGDVDDEPAE